MNNNDLKSSESYTSKNALLHHGIFGQKWGVQNGPPYPLDSKTSDGKKLKKEKKALEKQKKKASKKSNWEKASEMSYEDLKQEVEKLNLEKRYSELKSEKTKAIKSSKENMVTKIIKKELNKSLETIVDKTIESAVKRLTNKIDIAINPKEK